jgi:hypothetical protein
MWLVILRVFLFTGRGKDDDSFKASSKNWGLTKLYKED